MPIPLLNSFRVMLCIYTLSFYQGLQLLGSSYLTVAYCEDVCKVCILTHSTKVLNLSTTAVTRNNLGQ